MSNSVQEDISKFGISISSVEEAGMWPNFHYTIGMVESFTQPELICFGLPTNVVAPSINTLAEMAREGISFSAGNNVAGVFSGVEVALREFPKGQYQENVSQAVEFYGGTDFPVLQLFYPDQNGRFPWDEGSDVARYQPMFDQPAPRLGSTIVGTRIANDSPLAY